MTRLRGHVAPGTADADDAEAPARRNVIGVLQGPVRRARWSSLPAR